MQPSVIDCPWQDCFIVLEGSFLYHSKYRILMCCGVNQHGRVQGVFFFSHEFFLSVFQYTGQIFQEQSCIWVWNWELIPQQLYPHAVVYSFGKHWPVFLSWHIIGFNNWASSLLCKTAPQTADHQLPHYSRSLPQSQVFTNMIYLNPSVQQESEGVIDDGPGCQPLNARQVLRIVCFLQGFA